MRCWLLVALIACDRAPSPRQLDLGQISVAGAKLRTDTVGDGEFAEQATFVLVDGANDSDEGAYVTLGGELSEPDGTQVGTLKPQSLWVPAHASRTFALVDTERKPRSSAAAARIVVKGASVDTPPVAHVENVRAKDDFGKLVAQGELVNEAERPGTVMVIASFHDGRGTPMTRPFQMVPVLPKQHQWIQIVGPQGSKTADMYVGDLAY
jgi:hypothetical protein